MTMMKNISYLTLKKLRDYYSDLRKKATPRKLEDLQGMEQSNISEMESITSSIKLNYQELLIIPVENKITVVVEGKEYHIEVSREYLLSKAEEFLKRGRRSV